MKFVRNKSLYTKKIGEKWYILEPNKKIMRELNAVASTVWEALEKPKTPEELVKHVCKEYAVDATQAKHDIEVFLQQYQKENFVQRL